MDIELLKEVFNYALTAVVSVVFVASAIVSTFGIWYIFTDWETSRQYKQYKKWRGKR